MGMISNEATPATVTVREASFLVGLPVKAVNRAIDENRVPFGLLWRKGRRLLTPEGVFVLAFSREINQKFPEEIRRGLTLKLIAALRKWRGEGRRKISSKTRKVSYENGPFRVEVSLNPIAARVAKHQRQLTELMKQIVRDPNIQAGATTFRGTRILVQPVAQALDRGVSEAEILEDYPGLTAKMLRAARLHSKISPQRGRPRADIRGLDAVSERHVD
jgi:uncharacterized protein (DUF433 family)